MVGMVAYWSAAMLSAAQPALPAAQAPHSLFTTSGPMFDHDFKKPSQIWIQSFDDKARYSIAKPTEAEIAQMSDVLIAAYEAHLSLTIVYDAAAGRMDAESGKLFYPICSVRFDEKVFTSRHRCADRPVDLKAADPELLLAIGHALAEVDDWQNARDVLSKVLASSRSTPAMRRIALASRGAALEFAADEVAWTSDESDRRLIASVADFRSVAALDPADPQPLRAVARLLGLLGDIDGAMTIYRDSLKQWPDDDGSVSISMAAIARSAGDYKLSLDLLDAAVAKDPDGQRMRYYYHRGWTLIGLDRFDEAIAAFSEGIKTQPDYSWAYIKRGCAHARVGQNIRALDDIDRGIALVASYPTMVETAAAIADRRRRSEIRALLQQAVTSGITTPIPQACGGFPGPGESLRSKSRLLD